jgi:hypothetical protein
MMKKYPFSQKAVQAVLAASIAFAPMVTTGIGAPINASAASGTQQNTGTPVEQLVKKFEEGFVKLDSSDQKKLKDFQESLNALNQTPGAWEEVVADAGITVRSNTTEENITTGEAAAFIEGLISMVYAATPSSLEEAADKIITEYDGYIESILGVDADDFVNYLAAVELHVFASGLTDSDLSSTEDLGLALLSSMKAVGSSGTHQDVYEAIKFSLNTEENGGKLGLALSLAAIESELQSKLTGEQYLVEILAKVFLSEIEEEEETPPTGNTGSPGNSSSETTTTPSAPKGNVPATAVDLGANPSKVADAIKNAKEFTNLEVTLSSNTQNVSLPSAVIKAMIEKNKEATIDVKTESGSYRLPASEINLADLAKELGGSAENVQIKITVKVGKDDNNVLGANKLTAVSDVVEFSVEAEVNGKKKELKVFKSYVDRTIKGKQTFNADKAVALRLEENGQFTALPTYFDEDTASVKSMTNSQYVVIENNKTFNDLEKAWNKKQIEKLANKYIVQGRADGSFGPQVSTTRVQLAVLLTRALGLSTDTAYDGGFKDVKGDEWFVPELTAAVNAGIIQGKVDGTFDPIAPVNRAQAAVMINRALEFATYDKETELNKALKVEQFKDESKIFEWSRKDIETLLQAGIMQGRPDGSFDPYAPTTRAQMVKILDETLKTLKFINE